MDQMGHQIQAGHGIMGYEPMNPSKFTRYVSAFIFLQALLSRVARWLQSTKLINVGPG